MELANDVLGGNPSSACLKSPSPADQWSLFALGFCGLDKQLL
ncbi:MAG TPA: hypothetical protein VE641_09195 [Chthoniobacterales bacterium]|nr:hypothetical protein [Chthoniobacterales bacterium]